MKLLIETEENDDNIHFILDGKAIDLGCAIVDCMIDNWYFKSIVATAMEVYEETKKKKTMKKRDKILRKAKKRYPIGTRYMNKYNSMKTVKGILTYYHFDTTKDYITDGHGGSVWYEETGFARIVISEEDNILRTAKRKFPLGTKYINDCGNKVIVKGELKHYDNDTNSYITDGWGGIVWHSKTGFAKIIIGENILRKAKRLYPKGTKYVSHFGNILTVKGTLEYCHYHTISDRIIDGYGGAVWDYDTGFAKIIHKPFIPGFGGISVSDVAKEFNKAMLKLKITTFKVKLDEEIDKLLNDL